MDGDKARRSDTDGARPALAWLAHPITLVALIVLLVNDHLLKAAWPGVVTGKLSDVAGLVLAPPLLATLVLLLVRRAPAKPVAAGAVIVVGTAFAAVKAFPAAATVAAQAWSVLNGPSIVRADLTDLLALPALGLAWYTWTRARHRPVPGNLTRALRLGVILPVAVAGVVATSPAPSRTMDVASGVGPGIDDDVILVDEYVVTATSRDGRRWRMFDDPSPTPTTADTVCRAETGNERLCPNYPRGAIVRARTPHPMRCIADGPECYRVVPGALRIEQSTDGGDTWATAWEVDDLERERYVAVLEDAAAAENTYLPDEVANVRSGLTCTTIYIVPESEVVIAACGLVGFVRRDTHGVWAMIGFWGDPAMVPELDIATPRDVGNHLMAVLFGWFVLLLSAEAHALTHPRRPFAARAWIAGIASPLALVQVLGLRALRTVDLDVTFLVMLSLLTMLLAGIAWFTLYLINRRDFPAWVVPLAGLVTVVDWVLASRVLDAEMTPTVGWVATGSFTAIALAVNVTLAVVFPRPRRALPAAG